MTADDLKHLSPAPWQAKRFTGLQDGDTVAPEMTFLDWQACCLARNDLAVQLRMGWHAEKCTEADQWVVPQLIPHLPPEALEVAYQAGHPVGLLSKAYAWYQRVIEGKGATA